MMNTTLLIQKDEEMNLMVMKNSAKLPEDIREVAEELAKFYGMPINVLIHEIKTEHRRQRVKRQKERIVESVEYMDKLYKEDPELTEITRSLESEDFYDY